MATELLHLLGGAERGKTRVRGFAPWQPRAETRVLLAMIGTVLEEYAAYLPLTIRQVFYRLVGAHAFPKTEQAYDRLCEAINRARRAGLIAMDAIRDDGGRWERPQVWDSAIDLLNHIRSYHLRLDRTAGQAARLVVWCEAAGMVPQLARGVAGDYGIPVFSSGGFDSTGEKHSFAEQCAAEERPTEVLHIGDHDPSGAHLFIALVEDISAFACAYGAGVEFSRLAVTPEQIERLHLPTAPPKPSDHRAFAGETCQVEAIPPDELARILREAIEARLDRETFAAILEAEAGERRKLAEMLDRVCRGERD